MTAKNKTWMIIGGVLAVLLIGGAIFLVMKRKKTAPATTPPTGSTLVKTPIDLTAIKAPQPDGRTTTEQR